MKQKKSVKKNIKIHRDLGPDPVYDPKCLWPKKKKKHRDNKTKKQTDLYCGVYYVSFLYAWMMG